MNCPFSVNMFMIRAPFSRASRKMTKNDKGNSHRRGYTGAIDPERTCKFEGCGPAHSKVALENSVHRHANLRCPRG